jgi:uncharacterized protein YcfL
VSRNIRRQRLALALALPLVWLAGCAAPPPAPSDPRLIATPAVQKALQLQITGADPGPDGRLRVTVEARNPNAADVSLRYQAEWFDAAARPINTAQARAQFRSIPRSGVATLVADAPNPAARSFRILLDLDTP